MVSNFFVKRVMIDNRSALNIYTLKFIKQVGYIEANIINEVITIKAYENLERTTEGTILLPIRVGPATQETICHVFDLNLPFNILLGHPWIHVMKAIPSTYHQCLKFLHHGTKITICANPKPFSYCNVAEASYHKHCSGMEIGSTISSSSNTYHNPNTILASTLSTIKINNQDYGEYSLLDAFLVCALPLDPHTYGHPTSQQEKKTSSPPQNKFGSTIFVPHGILDGQESTHNILITGCLENHLLKIKSYLTISIKSIANHTRWLLKNGLTKEVV